MSRSEARRLLAQGGVRLDGEPLGGRALDVPAAELDGRVLQVGKRRFARLPRRALAPAAGRLATVHAAAERYSVPGRRAMRGQSAAGRA